MTHVDTSPAASTERDLADQVFWLARLDDSRPRASLSPDHARSSGGERRYNEVRFTFDADVVRTLKSMDPARGVSDVALCATAVAIVMSKYQREDDLIIGRLGVHDESSVLPMILPTRPDLTCRDLIEQVEAELSAVAQRSAQFLTQAEQVLGAPPALELAFAFQVERKPMDPGWLKFDAILVFEIDGGRLEGRVVYAQEVYRRDRMQAFARHLERAAIAAAMSSATPLRDLQVISDEERWKVVQHFNERTARFPLSLPLHCQFELQSSKTPEAIAAVHNDQRISYRDLDRRANQIANQLRELGLERGAFVGILLHRGVDFLASMLGVMKAAGAYVPLDPTYPEDRISYMLADSQAPVVISNAELISEYATALRGSDGQRSIVSVSGSVDSGRELGANVTVVQAEQLAAASQTNPGLPVRASDRAYMIYTSGSTGQPKGAICRHDGAVNHLFGELNGIGIQSSFRFLQSAASSSDISVWQFLAPLLFGGATVVVDYETVVDPALLFEVLRREAIDLAEPVPVVLRSLLDHVESLPHPQRVLPALQCMMVTGEALPVDLANRWLRLYPDIPIANTYGPTETSDDVTQFVMYEPLAPGRATVPIGAPLPNVTIFILDRDMRAVPVGVPGEICIAGIAVGEGYWNKPTNTQAAFVASAYPDKAPGLMYRTGDLGRWLPDGTVEFLGRIDQQVKIRGFRVEPGEIESTMTQHPAVQDAAVVATSGEAGLRLIGYYVLYDGAALNTADLRQHLKSALADHMVPSTLIPLQGLPTTPMGKVDRKALARSDLRQLSETRIHVAPGTATERLVASAWSVALERTGLSAEDNFFEAGGDSILTMRVVAELRKAGIRIAPRILFLHPTLSELARWIEEHPSASSAASTAPEGATPISSPETGKWRELLVEAYPSLEDVYSLCGTQRGIYYQSLLMRRNSGAYVEQISFDIDGELDVDLFAKAWSLVVQNTPVLRTAIVRRRTPQPLQVVVGDPQFLLDVVDLRFLPPRERDDRFMALLDEDRAKGYDLAKPPLTRGVLARLDDSSWRFLWSYHHVILDGWSEPLVLGDVMNTYHELTQGREPTLERSEPYRNFVLWSESQDLSQSEAFWRGQLAGFVTPVSIVDASPAVTPPSSAELLHSFFDADIPGEEFAALEQVCKRERVTLSTLVHGAWSLVLHARCGSSDVLFGSVASGRQAELPGIDGIRGLVVVTQPMRVKLAADATFGAWLRLLQLQMAEIREYEQTPLASIQQWSEVPAEKRPLFDTLVDVGNYHDVELTASGGAHAKIARVRYRTQPLYAITLFVIGGSNPSVQFIYDRRRYAADTIAGISAEFRRYLRGFAENAEQRVGGLLDAKAWSAS